MALSLTPPELRAVRLGPGAGRDPDRAAPPPHEAPAEPLPGETLAGVLNALFERAPEQRLLHFVNDDGTVGTLRAGEFGERAWAVAAGLRRAGVGPGDAVLLAMGTSPALVVSFAACVLAGATPCISDLPFSAHGAAAWQAKFRARAELTEARAVLATEAMPLVQGLGPVVLDPNELVVEGPDRQPFAATPDSLAFVQFTSGTVSSGRAIRLPNRAVLANLRQLAQAGEWSSSDVFVSWLPLYHDLGLVCHLLLPLSLGLPVVLLSPTHFLLRPASWLWSMHHFRATVAFAPNFSYEMSTGRVPQAETQGLDLSSLRDAFNCAEFVHASTLRRFQARYGASGFRAEAWRPAYGMAEVVVGASYRRRSEPMRIDRVSRQALSGQGRAEPAGEGEADVVEIASVGPVLPGNAVRVVGPDGAVLPERSEGVVQLAGPSIFEGYHRDPEATAAVLSDGWLTTGDLGYVSDGELYICGRTKDLIIKGGENHHPYAYELAAAEVEGVRAGRVAALGVPNPTTGTEDFVVAIETEEGDHGRLRELCASVTRQLLLRFGVRPDRVTPIPLRSIPKTTSGKIRRSALARDLARLDKLAPPTPQAGN